MSDAKILVTGGLGFIGSHTVVELLNKGYEVVFVDDLSNSQLFILDNIEKITGRRPAFYQVNMPDQSLLEKVFQAEQNIHAVIHFAASKAAQGLHWEAQLGLQERVTSAWHWKTHLSEIVAN